jgi:hypothetical protein
MLRINWLVNRKKLKRNAPTLLTLWLWSTGKKKLEKFNASVKLNWLVKNDRCSETTGLPRKTQKNA